MQAPLSALFHGLDSALDGRHFRGMTKDRNLSDSERARAERQAERLRANLQRRKAQQRARKQATPEDEPDAAVAVLSEMTGDESSILSEGETQSGSGPEKA